MTKTDIAALSDELVWFLRNNLTDPNGRGTDDTYNATATAGQTVFTISVAKIKNIKTVTVASVSKRFGFDYSVTIGATSATVTLNVGASVGQAVVITYHYGDSWIYDDFPQQGIKLGSSFPRISVTDVSAVMREAGLNASMTRTSLVKSITVYIKNSKDLKDTINSIKNLILDNKKNFYNFSLVVPVGMGPVATFRIDEGREEYVRQAIDVNFPFIYEA
jgi:hypothetical protein